MNRRTNMPLLRSLGRDQGTLPAIDMALLRSFSNRFKVPVHARSRRRLSLNRCSSSDSAAGCYPHWATRHSRGPWKSRFMVSMHVRRETNLSMNRRAGTKNGLLSSDQAGPAKGGEGEDLGDSWFLCALKNVPAAQAHSNK